MEKMRRESAYKLEQNKMAEQTMDELANENK